MNLLYLSMTSGSLISINASSFGTYDVPTSLMLYCNSLSWLAMLPVSLNPVEISKSSTPSSLTISSKSSAPRSTTSSKTSS
ncbi:hypothetical protein WICPIJ_007873 [Wickerhamomyces pijperi]|uniref:Uncharacterized protein n=1 Tax=Wickerhamomyces pijperi TaxID=599730 RepID=A0A9P8PZ56_WICPI|nr:hypothetical protein WICPIJ_007873 [Wickerhamomyces pijperi]